MGRERRFRLDHAIGKEATPGPGQAHTRPVTLEEPNPERVLRHAHPPAGGGRIEFEMLQNPPEPAGLGDRHDDLRSRSSMAVRLPTMIGR